MFWALRIVAALLVAGSGLLWVIAPEVLPRASPPAPTAPERQPTADRTASAAREQAQSARTTAPESPQAARPDAAPRPAQGQALLAIEVARVDPDGPSVFAGRAPSKSRVTLLADNRPIATATASEDGQWSAVVEERLPPGPVDLSLTSDSRQTMGLRSPALRVVVPRGKALADLPVAPARPRAVPAPAPSSAASAGPAGTAAPDTPALRELQALVDRARAEAEPASSDRKPGDSSQARPSAPPTLVPVPVTFLTGEATMTAEGRRAADLLAEYLRLIRPGAITLSGHADERGSDAYNIELSRRRLEAIEAHLRGNGFTGRLTLLPRGKSEPYVGIDRNTVDRATAWQADRRVELRMIE